MVITPISQNVSESSLVVEELCVEYRGGIRAVSGVSLELSAGECVAIVGPNGAGKTTLLQAIAGRVPGLNARVTGGSVRLDGRNITGLEADSLVKMGIVLVPERNKVFTGLTVREHLIVRKPAREGETQAQSIERVVELFPVLGRLMNRRAGFLSGGERQMLALGVALNVTKRMLLIDELSQGLSPGVLPPLAEAVLRVNQAGFSVLIVEQNARLAVQLTDKIHVMEDGRFLTSGGITDLIEKLKSESAGPGKGPSTGSSS